MDSLKKRKTGNNFIESLMNILKVFRIFFFTFVFFALS